MSIRWRGFELPKQVICDREALTDTYGRFFVEPFERGFGITVGNSMRRTLLSSLEGAAIVQAKILQVPHEFTTIPGVVEDVTDIVLNLKQVRVRMLADEPKTIRLEAKGKGPVRAGDFQCDDSVQIVNPTLLIATVSDEAPFTLEATVNKGRGYVTADENSAGQPEPGAIYLDANFSPVTRVVYRIEDTRVGKITNYDRLILEIWTNGAVGPDAALVEAGKILRKHLNAFVQYFESGEQMSLDERGKDRLGLEESADESRRKLLDKEIGELNLSVRPMHCLSAAKIIKIKDLVKMTEGELIQIKNFGKTSLKEIKSKLGKLGLSLGMTEEN